MSSLRLFFLGLAVFLLPFRGLVADEAAALPLESKSTVALILDVSGSMAVKDKLQYLKEASKLSLSIFDRTTIISFATSARAGAVLDLNGAQARRDAMRQIDALRIRGGTNYQAALRKLNKLPKGTVAIWISDGENTEGSDADVLALAKKSPGKIYTVGINVNNDARKLLEQMAAITGGAAANVERGEELTKAFVDIAFGVAKFRKYDPNASELSFPNTPPGSLITLAFDGVATMEATPSFTNLPFQHRAKLPNEDVFLTRVATNRQSNVVLRLIHKKKDGRWGGVLHNGLLQLHPHVPQLENSGRIKPGALLPVEATIKDSQGTTVSPRDVTDFQAGVQVLQDGKLVDQMLLSPSPDGRPLLVGTPKMPVTPGPVTLAFPSRDTSTGMAFDAQQRITAIVEKPITLAVEPSPLTIDGRLGEFEARLKITPSDNVPGGLTYTTPLALASSNCRLVGSPKSLPNGIRLRFRADKPGDYRGDLVIDGFCDRLVERVTVPYRIKVKAPALGLALKNPFEASLDECASGSGKHTIAEWKIPSRDEHPITWKVASTDLASGSHVIPLNCEPRRIAPTKGAPAPLKLIGEVGNVPAGLYQATITLTAEGMAPSRIHVRMNVTDALKVSPIAFGKVAAGGETAKRIAIRNVGGSDMSIGRISMTALTGDRGRLGTNLVDIAFSESPSVVRAGRSAHVNVRISLSQAIIKRGRHQAELLIHRDAGVMRVPVTIEIVNQGEGPSGFVVSPKELRLMAKPGETVAFSLAAKSEDGVSKTKTLQVSSQFSDAGGKPTNIPVDVQYPQGNLLPRTGRIPLKGDILAPLQSGAYTGDLWVESSSGGKERVKILLRVQ